MTDLTLDEVAERLMRMDPTRPGVGRLAQELAAAAWGLSIERAAGLLVPWHPGSTHHRVMVPRRLAA